jgi:hypothetical protein
VSFKFNTNLFRFCDVKRRVRKGGKRGIITMTKTIEILVCTFLSFNPPLGSWGRH